MGSPISVALAEITMQKIEQLIFENPPCDIAVWVQWRNKQKSGRPSQRTQEKYNHW